ncbi:MAG: hypothetical protein EBR88_08605 [Betaproteobacteria bacterium]|nr:hypothetical protein [Betaproteobacteria bacterium]
MKKQENPAVKATVRDFAERIRGEGLSPSMLEIQIAIAVEQLHEQHGIRVTEERLAELVG